MKATTSKAEWGTTQRKLDDTKTDAAEARTKINEYRTACNNHTEWNAQKREAAENLNWWIGKAAALGITIKNLEADLVEEAEFRAAWAPLGI